MTLLSLLTLLASHPIRKFFRASMCGFIASEVLREPSIARRILEEALRGVLPSLRSHFIDPDDLPRIPALLKKCGVRLVLVEQISGSKIDGVCTWLDDQPVIGLTNRLDRIDNLCFVLRHEIEHVLRGDGREDTFAPIDDFDGNLGSGNPDLPECEMVANAAAADFCVDQAMLQSFILRKSPYISEKTSAHLQRGLRSIRQS